MKRLAKSLAVALSAGMLLAGCGSAPTERATVESDGYSNSVALADGYDPEAHLSWGQVMYPSSWDPTQSAAGSDMNYWEVVYDRLLFEGDDGAIEPMLATSFTASADGNTLTLELREGLTFADGSPFDAEAVKFNLDRNRAQGSRVADQLYQVESVEVVDEFTVDIHLMGSIGSLPVALSSRGGVMVSPQAAGSGLLQEGPVGIGPYVTTNIAPGDYVEFERSEGYWDPNAQRIATITYHNMAQDQTRYNALMSGEIHGGRITPDQVQTLDDAGFVPLVEATSQTLFLLINTNVEPFGDVRVRKAINMAMDREAIAEGLYNGFCTPQIQPFQATSPAYSEKIGDGLDIFPHDPEAAKQLLAEAGVTGIEMTTAIPNVTSYTKLAEVLQVQFAEVGIDMSISAAPSAEIIQQFAIDKSVPGFIAPMTGLNDPDGITSRYILPAGLMNPGDAEYPELIEYGSEGASTIDLDERAAAYEKYMDAWVENPPHVFPICASYGLMAVADDVSGVSVKANGFPNLRYGAVA